MRRRHRILTVFIILFTFTSGHTGVPDNKKAPKTRVDVVKDNLHGVEISDPYRWLEEQNSPETRAWIERENAYTESILSEFMGRDALKKRLGELLKIDVVNIPTARNGRYFFTKRKADQDLSVIYMRQGLHGDDIALIDPQTMSEDLSKSVSIQTVSKDGSLLAYGIRSGGQDEIVVHIYDVNQKMDRADTFPKARYFGVAFLPDNSGLYYTRYDQKGSTVYYHKIGDPLGNDKYVFGEGYGPGEIIFAGLSDDGKNLLIHVLHGSAGKTEIYLKNLASDAPAVPVITDKDARTFGQIAGGKVFLFTDYRAPNKRLLSAGLNARPKSIDAWTEVVPESEFPITSFTLAGGKIFVNYLENVVSKVKVYNPDGTFVREIAFPSIGSVGGVSGNWDSNEAFFTYQSFTIPRTIYRYDVANGSKEVWSKLDVPVHNADMVVKQVWFESKDQTKIPMFLVHKKDLQLDGQNPTYLTGYGGFNVSLTPRFSATAALWVELGGVFAQPNLRGGGEFGEDWHKAGMLEKKQNVFDDFIAAAEWLIREKYTSSQKLAIAGGSNGGLLVGAALTQRPDLFKAVVCAVPLLDMVRYQKFLVARFWTPEYGSSDDVEQFKYLLKYSPYQNVKPGTKYPAVLFISGDSDTRVAPLHARKMTALLQAETGSTNPILLHYDTKAGHSGGKPVSKQIDDATTTLSFLLLQLGVQLTL